MARIPLCKTEDVRVGEARRVDTAGLTLAVLDGDEIECNFHQGRFNVRTGEVVLPPCMIPVRAYHTVVEDGLVCIEV